MLSLRLEKEKRLEKGRCCKGTLDGKRFVVVFVLCCLFFRRDDDDDDDICGIQEIVENSEDSCCQKEIQGKDKKDVINLSENSWHVAVCSFCELYYR